MINNLTQRIINKILAIQREMARKRLLDINLPIESHGTDYGAWTICPTGINEDSIVYSFGVGEDVSWDLAMIEHYGVTIHAFDPTPRSIEWVKSQTMPPKFQFYPVGIADYDGTARFNPPENPAHVSHTVLDRPETADKAIEVPVKRLQTLCTELGHDHIDILKMDIEGAEYAIIDDLINSAIKIRQLLVEFHDRFPDIGEEMTQQSICTLNQNGYLIFHISPSRQEYAFIYGE